MFGSTLRAVSLCVAILASACSSDGEAAGDDGTGAAPGMSGGADDTSSPGQQPGDTTPGVSDSPTGDGATPRDDDQPGDAPASAGDDDAQGAAGGGAPMAMCVDTELYTDTDGDGDAEPGATAETMCVVPGEATPGFGATMGDCAPADPWLASTREEICGDHYDDNCDASDDGEACPTTMAADIDVPDWDCVSGEAPANVYAHAHFPSGDGFFVDGACAIFFEGTEDLFYVKWQNLSPAEGKTDCDTYNGCVCPSSPSYDRRLYALTSTGEADCATLAITDHAGNDQPVSNECRKYLYALHGSGELPFFAPDGQPPFDLPFSHVATSLETLQARLELFPMVEVACIETLPHANLTYETLMEQAVVRNDGFQKM